MKINSLFGKITAFSIATMMVFGMFAIMPSEKTSLATDTESFEETIEAYEDGDLVTEDTESPEATVEAYGGDDLTVADPESLNPSFEAYGVGDLVAEASENTLTVTLAQAEALYVNDDTTPYTSVSTAQAAIQGVLDNAANTTVTVTGTLTDVTTTLRLTIPAGKTVVWNADYTGSLSGMGALMHISGPGAFEVAPGGSVVQTGDGVAITVGTNATINVAGGTVSADTGYAMYVESASEYPTINVTGGTVSVTSGYTISVRGFSTVVNISGGTVESSGTNPTVSAGGANNVITVSGGILRNTGFGTALADFDMITITDGLVENAGTSGVYPTITLGAGSLGLRLSITGGTVRNTGTNGETIYCIGIVFVNGGTVEKIGTGGGKFFHGPYGITIEKTGNTNTYIEGTSAQLSITGDNAEVVWAINEGRHGINYNRDGNEGFIEVQGVTVTPGVVEALFVNNSVTPYYTVSTAQAAIQAALNDAGTTTVSVTGTLINVTSTMTLNIPTGKTVMWGADFTGNLTANSALVSITGAGAFLIAREGSIIQTGAGNAIHAAANATISVEGGMVSATAGSAISSLAGLNVVVNVRGGIVESSSSNSTISGNTNSSVITVSGGTVRNTGTGRAISEFSLVNITNGLVENVATSAENAAIVAIDGSIGMRIHISGGTVRNTGFNGFAIYSHGVVFVNGGTVENTGTGTDKYSLGANGIAIEKTGNTNTYIAGTSNELNVIGTSASAVWVIDEGRHGIHYQRYSNAGFIEVPGVTVSLDGVTALYVNGGATPYYTVLMAHAAIQGALDNAANTTVIVSGALTSVVNTLYLNIPAGKTVVWVAGFTGSPTSNVRLMDIIGTGTFEIASGGSLILTGSGTAISVRPDITVNVTGGTVSATTGYAIYVEPTNARITINVTEGMVSATTGYAIIASGPDAVVNISGGTVESSGSNPTIGGNSDNGVITVSGGTVCNTGIGGAISDFSITTVTAGLVENAGTSATYAAITTYSGSYGLRISISGGTVRNTGTDGYAIYTTGVAFINGGTVEKTGTGGGRYGLGAFGIAVEKTGNTNAYTAGTNVELYIEGSGATAIWAIDGSRHGVQYNRNTNTGFFEVPGVTVNPEVVEALFVNNSFTPYYTVSTAQTAIQASLNDADTTTVAVIGSLTNVASTMTLNIPTGKTLVWGAGFTGSMTADSALLSITGPGAFVIAREGSIMQAGAGIAIHAAANATISVEGGMVSATTGYAINADAQNITVNVAGGTVSATAGDAIYVEPINNINVTINITGGTVRAITGSAISSLVSTYVLVNVGRGTVESSGPNPTIRGNTNNSVITVSGGLVRNNGTGSAISGFTLVNITGGLVENVSTVYDNAAIVTCNDSTGLRVQIKGGTVRNTGTDGYAIYTEGVVFVDGGTVEKTGTGGGRYYLGNTGIAIERTGYTNAYIAGTSNELNVIGTNATAVWAINEGRHGIQYQRNTNTGFIEVQGITVSAGIHEHNWDEGVVTTPATCTENGVMTHTCTGCDVTKTEIISAAGHDYKPTITAPTCTEQGFTTYKCSVCNHEYIDENSYVPVRNHNFIGVGTKAATCIEEGEVTYTCEFCPEGQIYSVPKNPDYHVGGKSTKVITAATCAAVGSLGLYCDDCDALIEATEIPKNADNHAGGTYETVITPATPEDDGEMGIYCKGCDALLDSYPFSYSGHEPVKTLRITDANGAPLPAIVTVMRGSTISFGLELNAGAVTTGIVWTVNNPALATVDQTGKVTVKTTVGALLLTARDTETGVSQTIALRII